MNEFIIVSVIVFVGILCFSLSIFGGICINRDNPFIGGWCLSSLAATALIAYLIHEAVGF